MYGMYEGVCAVGADTCMNELSGAGSQCRIGYTYRISRNVSKKGCNCAAPPPTAAHDCIGNTVEELVIGNVSVTNSIVYDTSAQ